MPENTLATNIATGAAKKIASNILDAAFGSNQQKKKKDDD